MAPLASSEPYSPITSPSLPPKPRPSAKPPQLPPPSRPVVPPIVPPSTGGAGVYNPGAVPLIGGQTSDHTKWPSWRQSLKRWEWKQIPGTDLATLIPKPAVRGNLSARIDAWNGLAADIRTNRLFSAANGGHADYSGNGVYEIDLSVDSPRWRMLRAPTPEAEIVSSNYNTKTYNDYYLDGRPASTHTYYALQFLASRNAVFKFGAGSLWGTGNEANWKTDAFSLSNDDWQPAGTWPDVVANSRRAVIAASICIDPTSDEVYVAAPGGLRRFDPALGRFSVAAKWIQNSTAVYNRACAVDTRRNQVVFFGDAYRRPTGGLLFNAASRSLSQIDFSGEGAVKIAHAGANSAWYEPTMDRFMVKTRESSAVYTVDPKTFAVESLETSGGASLPDAKNGVYSRWQRLPKLGGYAYYPRSGSGIWFLTIE